ncbi:hypothetical protein Tco_0977853 [Tanacetum coccineum]|uniref:Integrase, catalytic region, zinc finger, CCHC-type, peptidase aspartic, catalytic n=1 Tax=Tanacetum coccineum TaxID=301880 RepID=A0ABQ5ELA0_9ASTR
MATIAENVIAAGSETRPPMLEKGIYDSWKTRIILYIRGKENGEMLKDSIDNGPYQFKSEIPIKDTDGITEILRPQRLEDLEGQDKLRYDSDIKAVIIFLLGLPVDIYTLINHYQNAKEIWDRVKELMEGTEMTKQERESMLYNKFDKFTFEPGESIHSYYMRYTKLTNDMKMIPMTMSPMQINTKFVNQLQTEWSRFVTTAKQARDLHSVTFDQLYAFLKHNEKDALEVTEMRQQFSEPLALLVKTYNPPPSYRSPQTQYHAQPTKVYQPYQHYQSSTLITQQLIQSPPLQSYAPIVVQQPPTYQPDTGIAIPTFLSSDDPIESLNKAMIFLSHMAKQYTMRKRVKDSECLEEIDDCEDLQLQATANFKVDHIDAYDSDCDDEATTNIIFMENLSPVGSLNDDMVEPHYDSNMISKVPHYDTYHDSDMLNSNIQKLGYIENIISNNESYDELMGNSNVISYTNYMLTIGNDEDNYVPLHVFSTWMAFEGNTLAGDGVAGIKRRRRDVSSDGVKNFATASGRGRLKEDESSTCPPVTVSKPKVFPKKLSSTSQVLKNLNKARDLLTNFDKCIKRRTTLSPHEIGSWEQSDIKEVKEMKNIFEQMEYDVDQCSVAKKSFEIEKKQLLINNDQLLEENITSDKMCTYLRLLNEVDNCGKCKSLDNVLLDLQESNKSLSELRKRFAKLEEYNITLDIAFQNHKEQMILNDPETKNKQFLVKTINNQSVEINDLKVKLQDKLHIINEFKHLLAQKSQKTQCESLVFYYRIQKIEDENLSPTFQLLRKNDLSKPVTSYLTTKKIIEKCTKVLAPGLLKIKSEPINAYFKNNRAVHHDYLKVTKEHVATLHELLENARALKPLDEHIDHASKFDERIQELLVYVSASCPFTQSENEKWDPATSHRKNNKPFVDASRTKQTIETITQEHAVKQKTQKTDNSMFPSTGRVSSTNASGSKPRRITKNDRIPQSSCKSMKNKVEAHHRKFKSSANKNNHVSACNANVKNVKNVALSKNFDTICLSCNECLFSANHDAYVAQYLKKI